MDKLDLLLKPPNPEHKAAGVIDWDQYSFDMIADDCELGFKIGIYYSGFAVTINSGESPIMAECNIYELGTYQGDASKFNDGQLVLFNENEMGVTPLYKLSVSYKYYVISHLESHIQHYYCGAKDELDTHSGLLQFAREQLIELYKIKIF